MHIFCEVFSDTKPTIFFPKFQSLTLWSSHPSPPFNHLVTRPPDDPCVLEAPSPSTRSTKPNHPCDTSAVVPRCSLRRVAPPRSNGPSPGGEGRWKGGGPGGRGLVFRNFSWLRGWGFLMGFCSCGFFEQT